MNNTSDSALAGSTLAEPTAAPVVPQKVRPFSFLFGLGFLAIGLSAFASDAFGGGAGAIVSFCFLVASCAVLYLILRRRRLLNAARTYVAPPPTPAGPDQNLIDEALAELDSVDYTVASPERTLGIDPGSDATGDSR